MGRVAQGWFLRKVHVKITLHSLGARVQVEQVIDPNVQSSERIKDLEANSSTQANAVNENLAFVSQCSQPYPILPHLECGPQFGLRVLIETKTNPKASEV